MWKKAETLFSCIEQQKECLMEQEKQKKRAGNLSRAQVWEDDRVLVYPEECRKKAGIRTPDERDFVILRDICPVDRKLSRADKKSIGVFCPTHFTFVKMCLKKDRRFLYL